VICSYDVSEPRAGTLLSRYHRDMTTIVVVGRHTIQCSKSECNTWDIMYISSGKNLNTAVENK